MAYLPLFSLFLPLPSQRVCQRRDSWAAIRAQLSSPMTWMMLASVAMAFFFPKMLSGMGTANDTDRERRREIRERL